MNRKLMICAAFICLSVLSVYAYRQEVPTNLYGAEVLEYYSPTRAVKPRVFATWAVEQPSEDWYHLYLDYCINVNPKTTIITYESYMTLADYWVQFIPKKYMYVLLNESLKQGVPMRYIFAIARTESEFKYFTSHKLNANGTVDVGLMGLNSSNFDTSTDAGLAFIESYFYFDDEYVGVKFNKNNQLHIVKTCTRFLKVMLRRTGEFYDASICYNGGYQRWASGKPKQNAIIYANVVSSRAKVHKFFNPEPKTYDVYLLKRTYDLWIERLRVRQILYGATDVSYRKKWDNMLPTQPPSKIPEDYLGIFKDIQYDRTTYPHIEVIVDSGVFLGTLSEDGGYITIG